MGTSTPGHEERIVVVYRQTIDQLYRYVSRNCAGDRTLAEDVTQETWLRAVRDWRKKGPPDQPIAWLITVARNLLVSYYRRKRPAALQSVSPSDVLAALENGRAAESSEITAVVCHALARIPNAQAQILEAFHFEDRRMSQIAETLGLSERAVEGRLRRARQSLRRELESLMKIEGASR
jgi:RNA polymerase sigma-70 factor (ECF subfamily)